LNRGENKMDEDIWDPEEDEDESIDDIDLNPGD
jgi:hypothetical protein